MKKPIYNMVERWTIREVDCYYSACMKFNIEFLRFRRTIDFEIKNLYSKLLTKRTKSPQ